MGFVGTGWFRQIGSSRNLSKLVPLGLPASSEGRRGSEGLPGGPRVPDMCRQEGKGDPFPANALQPGGAPCSRGSQCSARPAAQAGFSGQWAGSVAPKSADTEPGFPGVKPTGPQPFSTRRAAAGASREPSSGGRSEEPRGCAATGSWACTSVCPREQLKTCARRGSPPCVPVEVGGPACACADLRYRGKACELHTCVRCVSGPASITF